MTEGFVPGGTEINFNGKTDDSQVVRFTIDLSEGLMLEAHGHIAAEIAQRKIFKMVMEHAAKLEQSGYISDSERALETRRIVERSTTYRRPGPQPLPPAR